MDQHIIAGLPVFMPEELKDADIPPLPKPYRGSIQIACQRCERLIWIGPAQQLMHAEEPDVPIWCMVCCITSGYYNPKDTQIIALTDKKAGD